jgi:predicted DNA-binding protein (MmcQ/YjbR family)
MTKPPALAGFTAKVREIALAYPETTEEHPWGETAIKVRGKIFVYIGNEGDAPNFSVKLPSTGMQALALPFAAPTHYGMGKHGWVTITIPKRVTRAFEAQVAEWVRESYVAVAPKKLGRAVASATHFA